MIPFGDKVTDYFRKYQSAQTHLDGILHALRDGQDELGKDNAALNLEKQYLWDAMGRLNQYVYVAERLDARLAGQDRRARGHRPRQGQGAARGRAVLRPPEAPGPADPAGRLDPELPGDRHHHQEQHRADQGRRPGLDDDGLGAAHRGHRRPGAGQPEARPRPDHGAQHHDVRDDRAHLARCSRDNSACNPAAGGVGDHRARPAAGGVRQHLRDDGRHRHVQGPGPGHHGRDHRHPGDRGRASPRPTSSGSQRQRRAGVATGPLDLGESAGAGR